MSMWKQMIFQDANSPIMENMIMFHDHAMLIIMMIIILIMYMLVFMLKNKLINRFMLEGQMIEMIWTIIPIFFLVILAIPSLKILYMTDEMNLPMISIKIIGHQWYWSYEYNDFNSINFDSFMLNNKDLNNFRLLDVDNRMILPYNNQIRLLVNSSDVIHSFTIPSLGMKIDAVPGRINQVSLLIKRPGLYYGQCSEICGVNHSFMPIVLESTNLMNFINWIKNN
uniref:Cytochrome c oxidase subunit 2 n=1 Tax=Pachyneuron aphidis TaxID=909094 RepID=A0A6G6DAE5_9HYME|nr:cytochrome c oxidase subunit II [Pachyneuron aphidis]